MSVGTTCFVSMDYFRANHRFADFVVHDAAHIFHNCKRRTLGLPETRGPNGCSRSTSRSARPSPTRVRPTAVFSSSPMAPTRGASYISNSRVDPSWEMRWRARDYLEAVRAAIAARNGSKRILHACAPPWARCARSLEQPA
jgi:hypothetical protein